jgi:hypothetical protein
VTTTATKPRKIRNIKNKNTKTKNKETPCFLFALMLRVLFLFPNWNKKLKAEIG